MILVTSALAEELKVALDLCRRPVREAYEGVRLVRAESLSGEILFLKTGVGPARSAERLERTLRVIRPTAIWTIGYAGALDPSLHVGDLVIARTASMLALHGTGAAGIGQVPLAGTWNLSEGAGLFEAARGAGLPMFSGSVLTSASIIGDPAQKQILYRRFGAAAVDMETASIARISAAHEIPCGCIRAISDDAGDEFLAPFSYDPAATALHRATKVLAAGNWILRYREWRDRAAIARDSLRRVLGHLFRSAGSA